MATLSPFGEWELRPLNHSGVGVHLSRQVRRRIFSCGTGGEGTGRAGYPHSGNLQLPVLRSRERLVLEYERTGELLVDLGSDQTSLHNPFNGGYYPVQLSFPQANQVMAADPDRFKTMVQER